MVELETTLKHIFIIILEAKSHTNLISISLDPSFSAVAAIALSTSSAKANAEIKANNTLSPEYHWYLKLIYQCLFLK